jgi:UDP-N-acetylenolpyruvoylglucosamine reductase
MLKQFLKIAVLILLVPGVSFSASRVNDIHSQLNPTQVDRIVQPKNIEEIQSLVRDAKKEGKAISIAGGRHAMGGQQFGEGTVLLDMSAMKQAINFDSKRGLIEVEAGIQWPELVDYLLQVQKGQWPQWGIIQKQTGADRLSIGGALSANIHGRGLKFKPIIGDVESFLLIDADGRLLTCSRTENPELFRLVIGGYGLFGVIARVQLRLLPRVKLERIVEIIEIKDLMTAFEKRKVEGFLYGDFQYAIDPDSEDFLRKGVFSCYRPVDEKTPIAEVQKELSAKDWDELYYLAHAEKKKIFDVYSKYYLSTSGQIYWSDVHQMSVYTDNYHELLDKRLKSSEKATEMITEIYVPHKSLIDFMEDVRNEFLQNKVEVIYGTIRLIEKDDESFLAWARESYACVIFNLHVIHNNEGLARARDAFRKLIDLGIRYKGSYFLTYHKFATRQQVESCYPQFPEFLRLKKKYDPEERFQSEWYRHYKKMFEDILKE